MLKLSQIAHTHISKMCTHKSQSKGYKKTSSSYLCFTKPGTGCGVNCDAAATFFTFHGNGDIGKPTAGPAF